MAGINNCDLESQFTWRSSSSVTVTAVEIDDDMSTKKRSRSPRQTLGGTFKSPDPRITPDAKTRRICGDSDGVQDVVDQLTKVKVNPYCPDDLPGGRSSVFYTPDDTPDTGKFSAGFNGVLPIAQHLSYPTPCSQPTTPWNVVQKARKSTDIPKFSLHDDDVERDDITQETNGDDHEFLRPDTTPQNSDSTEKSNCAEYVETRHSNTGKNTNAIFNTNTVKNNVCDKNHQDDITKIHCYGNVSLLKFNNGFATPTNNSIELNISSKPTSTTIIQSTQEKLPWDCIKERLKCIGELTIGKKMGLQHVDVLTELSKLDLTWLVFQHVTDEDLLRIPKVCKSWNKAIHHDPSANRRRLELLETKHQSWSKENYPKKCQTSRMMTPCDKGPLNMVQPMAAPSVSEQTPTTVTRTEEYTKVVKSLYTNESLNKCPKCSSPAKVVAAEDRAKCTRYGCCFDFCTKCHCQAHGVKKCPGSRDSQRSKVKVHAGSAKSKKNLKRL